MSLLSRNRCANAFGNWSRGKNFRPKKPRGSTNPPCQFYFCPVTTLITGLIVPTTALAYNADTSFSSVCSSPLPHETRNEGKSRCLLQHLLFTSFRVSLFFFLLQILLHHMLTLPGTQQYIWILTASQFLSLPETKL